MHKYNIKGKFNAQNFYIYRMNKILPALLWGKKKVSHSVQG